MLPVRERATDRRRRVVADAEAAAIAVVAVELVVIQEAPLPLPRELMSRDDRPVVVLNLPPELGDQARNTHRARVPAITRRVDLALANGLVRRRDLRAARSAQALRIAGALLADLFDQRR